MNKQRIRIVNYCCKWGFTCRLRVLNEIDIKVFEQQNKQKTFVEKGMLTMLKRIAKEIIFKFIVN